jgi:uncharacterized protein YdeI (YjbR/CyaY-like superfamily)
LLAPAGGAVTPISIVPGVDNVTYFARAEEFRAWLTEHHGTETELLVGYHKVATGKPSMTWAESVDEALCAGWIDGIRRSVDDERYCIRFTPRKPTSKWSAVNIKRMGELLAEGRVLPAGVAAFEAWKARGGTEAGYSYEDRKAAALDPAGEKRFRGDKRAWEFFRSQPPGYRQTAISWVMSAKKEETRARRLATLIDDSSHRRRLAALSPKSLRQ